eukprot:GILK01010730.1.p1 GENE.GILK01010730.1~~GILK01010730.1.p1  ORF type:complete len:198 (-),score=15.24 GILK01010730.1:97-690(-)
MADQDDTVDQDALDFAPDSPPLPPIQFTRFPSVVDRYYQHHFQLDVGGNFGEDQYINLHSNKLIVVGLAPSHVLFSGNAEITSVNFNVDNQDRMSNAVRGKRKKGGFYLEPHSTLCEITCADGRVFRPKSVVRGHLLELNERLIANPRLLLERPKAEGYLAILKLRHENIPAALEPLLTTEQYQDKRMATQSAMVIT